MNDSRYIKATERDEQFSKRADDAGRLYKSHAVADDIARELYEALIAANTCTGYASPEREQAEKALTRYEALEEAKDE